MEYTKQQIAIATELKLPTKYLFKPINPLFLEEADVFSKKIFKNLKLKKNKRVYNQEMTSIELAKLIDKYVNGKFEVKTTSCKYCRKDGVVNIASATNKFPIARVCGRHYHMGAHFKKGVK